MRWWSKIKDWIVWKVQQWCKTSIQIAGCVIPQGFDSSVNPPPAVNECHSDPQTWGQVLYCNIIESSDGCNGIDNNFSTFFSCSPREHEMSAKLYGGRNVLICPLYKSWKELVFVVELVWATMTTPQTSKRRPINKQRDIFLFLECGVVLVGRGSSWISFLSATLSPLLL